MPLRPTPRASRIPRHRIALMLTALSLALMGPLSTAAQDAGPGPRYRLEVRLDGESDLLRLGALGVDIAGVNRLAGIATVIAGEADRARITSLGFAVATVETRAAAPEALGDYKDPAEISAFLDQVQAQYPGLAKKVALTGPLFEGHTVYAMKITQGVDRENDRPAFLLDAQHHAREVMTPEIALDAVDYLTSRYATDPEVRRWVDSINIWVVPSVNPDGADTVFTQDRWWRRNRHPGCAVDVNRNYPFNWGACNGSEGSCSSEINRGTAPGSEPETQGMLALMEESRPLFELSYHSYGQYILSPYGCTDPSESNVFTWLGQNLNAALEDDYGQTGNYLTGPGWSTIYQTDGTTLDAAYGLFGTAAFTIEVNCCDFQPDYAQWRDPTVRRQRTAWQYFLDRTLDTPSVRGRVTDSATGNPLAATVTVAESPLLHGEVPRTTDSRGRYARILDPGETYHVTFTAPGYCTKTLAADVGTDPTTLDVQLDPSSATPPGSPSPAHGSPGQPLQVTLTWEDSGATSYHVFFGTTSEPPPAATVTAPSFTPPTLELGRTYYWRVAVSDACGTTAGPLWSFSTHQYAITGAKKKGNPFRIVLTGSRFTNQCTVAVDGAAVPASSFKAESKLVAKGGTALKAMVPKGKLVTLTVSDGAGGTSAPFPFSW